MGAVLSHPKIMDASVAIMVEGMNEFATQPDLGDKLLVMNEHLRSHQETMARQMGSEAPRLVSQFFGGLMAKREKEGNVIEDDPRKSKRKDSVGETVSEGVEIEKTPEMHVETPEKHPLFDALEEMNESKIGA